MTPYQRAAESIQRELQADRVLVLAGTGQSWEILCSLGLQVERLEDAPISLSLIEEVASSGQAQIIADVKEAGFDQHFSVLVGGVQALACLPWWTPEGRLAGVLYADSHSRSGFFAARQLSNAQRAARQLESDLYGKPATLEEEPVPQVQVRRSPTPAGPARPAGNPLKDAPNQVVLIPERAFWLRCLALMLESGIGFARAFEVLMQTSVKPAHQQALQQILQALEGGLGLHQALALPKGLFSRAQLQLVRAGEASGGLVLVLRRLADHEEKMLRHQQKLRSALVYPALVLCLAALIMVGLTPWVLRGQLQVLQGSGQALPWSTQVLLTLSEHQGLLALGLGASAFLAIALARRYGSLVPWFRVPLVAPLLRSSAVWRFCQTYALLQDAGLPLPETLRYSAEASLHPPLEANSAKILQRVLDGSSVAEALHDYADLGGLVSETVRAGEETGKISEMLRHAARMAELQFEMDLEAWSKMLEPILVALMGLFVGLVLLATLAPTVSLLQNL